MVGTGPVFGKSQKLLIDFGAVFGYVDRLSNAYNLASIYTARPDNMVVSSFGGSYYFALHYLFFKP